MSDPWSGIPDDLRKAAERYGAARANICWAQRGIWTDVEEAEAELPAAEVALCAALRALVADRELLDRLDTIRWDAQFAVLTFDEGDVQIIPEDDRENDIHTPSFRGSLAGLVDYCERRATPRGAQEDAE